MNFSVIIPTKDRKEIISKSLNSLKKVTNIKDLQIIIINDSEIPLDIDLTNFPTDVQVLRNPGKGVASARNFGASKGMYEWLIFMDDDMIVTSETFEKLGVHYDHKDRCLNINWVYPDFITRQESCNPFVRYLKKYRFDTMEGWSNNPNWDNSKLFKVGGVNSAFLMIHKVTFEKIGGYDEHFPFAGFEDHDLSERLKKYGVEMFVDPTNVIYHNEEDRIKLENWLERKRRGAITRKVAVARGYADLNMDYSPLKKIIYQAVYNSRTLLFSMLENWPQTKRLDKLYFLFVNRLLGAYSYVGYTQKDK